MDPNQHRAGPRMQTSFLILIFLLPFIAIMFAMHQVPEGHVGAYWRGRALQKTITEPGFQVKMPFITQYDSIQVTLQTYLVPDISCVTKGGVKTNFKNIQVVHQLQKEYVYDTLLNYGLHYKKTWIHDQIHHHIIQFCTSHSFQEVYIDKFVRIGGEMKEALQADCRRYAPGIKIFRVHVTKPNIPDSIRCNFEQLEVEHMKGLIAIERQKVAKKEAKTSKILKEQTLLKKEGSRHKQEIENQMYLQQERCHADANFYQATKEPKANRLKLALEYIKAIVEIAKRSSDLVRLLQYLQALVRYFFR